MLGPPVSDDDTNEVKLAIDEKQDSPRKKWETYSKIQQTWTLFVLTISFAGIQFLWTVELAQGAPYLTSLGLSKSANALVWIAGPLSGLVMQPIIGAMSDQCTSKFGRRRPFIIGGAFLTIVAVTIIAYAREIANNHTSPASIQVIVIVVIAFYLLDFAVNACQACLRSLVIDTLPPKAQGRGNGWAALMLAVGSVLGYSLGYADLKNGMGWLGNTQLKILCNLASFFAILTIGLTSYYTKETQYKPATAAAAAKGWVQTITFPFKALGKQIWTILVNIRRLPAPIQKICNVQFFAWFGMFPFLFYSTEYITERLIAEEIAKGVDPAELVLKGNAEFVRHATLALLIYSTISGILSFLLPYIAKLPLLTVTRIWRVSIMVFAILMFATFAVKTAKDVMIIISLTGLVWAVTTWAPFTLVGEWVSGEQRVLPTTIELNKSTTSDEVTTCDIAEEQTTITITEIASAKKVPSAGIILGIHNMYCVIPQFLACFIGAGLFKLCEAKGSPDGIPWLLRLGGLSALIAFVLAFKVKERIVH